MKRLVTVAVVGLGRWGLNYCRTLARLDGCQLVAAVDLSSTARMQAAEILHKIAPQCRLLSDISALRLLTPAAAVIATPQHTHFAIAKFLLTVGLNVLIEKPMTTSSAEALSLWITANRYRRVLAVGHTSIYSSRFQQIVRFCRPLGSGLILAQRTSTGIAGCNGNTVFPEHVLWDLAPHDIAMAVLLAGNPVVARCRAIGNLAVEYRLGFAGGAIMKGFAAWRRRRMRRFRVTTLGHTFDAGELLNGGLPFEELPLTKQCRDFIAACSEGRSLVSNAQLGVATVRTIETLAACLSKSLETVTGRDMRQAAFSRVKLRSSV